MHRNINAIIRNRLICIACLATILITLLCLCNNVAVCEWWATNYVRWYVAVADTLLGWIPFSLYEVSIVLLVVALLVMLVLIIVRLSTKKLRRALALFLVLVIMCLSIGTLYVSTATMLYNRQELSLDIYSASDDGVLDYDTTIELAQWYVQLLNYCADNVNRVDGVVSLPTIEQMGIDIETEYEASNYLDGYVSSYYVQPQYDTFSWVLCQLGIGGIFFAPYAEINVNGLIDYATLPATIAHEMAHSKGIMSETDANTVARYLLVNSQVTYLQYAGLLQCYSAVSSLLSLVQSESTDTYVLSANLSEQCYSDIVQLSDFWSQYTLLDDLGDTINNIYLKLSGVDDGTASYNPSEQVEDSGQLDSNGDIIWTVVEYSPTQNVIIQAFINSL